MIKGRHAANERTFLAWLRTAIAVHGAALTSFAKLDDQAAAQKLHGAAKTSFTTKCLSDATGA